ncbi:MAG: DNA (cytosine-5-)-methyltransferase [Candidatus Thorarchaeota archaeon]|jgi:DNA (cytosine-5)-methyltransferase 1
MALVYPEAQDIPQSAESLYNHVCAKLSDLDMEMIQSIPPGGNWKDIPVNTAVKSSRVMQIRESGGRTTYYGRLRTDLPSYTINTYFNRPGNGTFIHPYQNRLISHREASRLQSFPDSFRFLGSNSSIYRQIGNAVPPLMARALGLCFKNGNVVDLFAGAGGLSRGLELAGHKMILASDIDSNMCQTLAFNHPKAAILRADITDQYEYRNLIEEIEEKLEGKTLNLLVGGPPCQGFSTAGKWDISDERNSLVFAMIRVVKRIQPEHVIIENVPGMTKINNGKSLECIVTNFKNIGYRTMLYNLRSEEYGVPQRRRRVFIIALRSEDEISNPAPVFSALNRGRTREDVRVENEDVPPPVTVGEAISDLPCITSGGGREMMIYDSSWLNSDYQRLLRGRLNFDSFAKRRAE